MIVDNTYDADNMLNRGVVYRWSSSVPSNAPLSYAAMIVYKIGPTNYAQFCISRTWGDRHAMLKRVLKDNNEWSPWQRIYDEGILNDSAILSPLASALGGSYRALSNGDNLNDCTADGVMYYSDGSQDIANQPTDAPNYVVFTYKHGNRTGRKIQILYSFNADKIYWRRLFSDISNTWSDWRVNYDSSILTSSSILSPLASALGAVKNIVPGTDFSSLDDIAINSITALTGDAYGGPDPYSVVITRNTGIAYYNRIQFMIHCGVAEYVYVRIRTSNTWGVWFKYYGTRVQ